MRYDGHLQRSIGIVERADNGDVSAKSIEWVWGPIAYHDAVLQGDPSQLQGLEQLWRMGAIGLGIGGSTSRRLLRWGVVADAFGRLVFDGLARKVLLLGFWNSVMRRHGATAESIEVESEE